MAPNSMSSAASASPCPYVIGRGIAISSPVFIRDWLVNFSACLSACLCKTDTWLKIQPTYTRYHINTDWDMCRSSNRMPFVCIFAFYWRIIRQHLPLKSLFPHAKQQYAKYLTPVTNVGVSFRWIVKVNAISFLAHCTEGPDSSPDMLQ